MVGASLQILTQLSICVMYLDKQSRASLSVGHYVFYGYQRVGDPEPLALTTGHWLHVYLVGYTLHGILGLENDISLC